MELAPHLLVLPRLHTANLLLCLWVLADDDAEVQLGPADATATHARSLEVWRGRAGREFPLHLTLTLGLELVAPLELQLLDLILWAKRGKMK